MIASRAANTRHSAKSARARWLEITVDILRGVWLPLAPLLVFLASSPRKPIYTYGAVDTREITPFVTQLATVAVLFGLLPAALSLASGRIDPRRLGAFPFLALGILLSITVSLLQNGNFQDISILVLGTLVFAMAGILACDRRSDDKALHQLLAIYAVAHCVIMIVVVADNNFLWGRLMGRVGPNFWGQTAYYTFFAALVLRNVPLRFAVLGWSIAVQVLCQNRTSMIATAAGLAVVILLVFLASSPRRKLAIATFCLLAGLILAAALPFLAQHVFLIDDPRRGVGSGGTGRFEAWAETIDVWARSPIFGVGYRHHEEYISAASSAHNAYLATLADTGLFGLSAYLIFLGAGIYWGAKRYLIHRSTVALALTGFVVAYAASGLFEKRAINFGNSGSLLLIIAVAWLARRSFVSSRPAEPATPLSPH